MWVMRNLSFLGKISIFKTLSFSKIIYLILVLVTYVPSSTIDILNKIQKRPSEGQEKCKNKHTTLCCDYANGGLKSVDIISTCNTIG